MNKNLFDVIEKAANAISNAEKFPVSILAVRLKRAAQEYPHDYSIITASNVLDNMSEKQTFISRADLNKLYDKLYYSNSKLGIYLEDELGRKKLATPTMYHRSEFEGSDLKLDYERVADPMLANAFEAMFDGTGEERLYSKADAGRAVKVCEAELRTTGAKPKKVEIFAGRGETIVCQATYETPKGESHMLVPVDFVNGKPTFPSMFLSKAGFVELNKTAIKEHIKSTAGRNFKVDGQALLDVLETGKYGIHETDEVGLAAVAMKIANGTPSHDLNGILYIEVDPEFKQVEIPQMQRTAEEESFAKRLENPAGIASFIFGNKTVEAGRNMLQRKFASFGFSNVQISVSDVNDAEIKYAVAVDNISGMEVPVKIADGLVMQPKMAFANGEFDSFTADGVSRLMAHGDSRILAIASPMFEVHPAQLLEEIFAAVGDGNMAKVEEAMHVLAETDAHAYKRAFDFIMEANNPETLKKVASEQKGCSMIRKSAASSQPLCGHLNLPLSKVYQDRHGSCRPLSRKGHEEANEGGYFMSQKIFL